MNSQAALQAQPETPTPSRANLLQRHELGGLAEVAPVQPGSHDAREILLDRYLKFSLPGDYEIRCEFDARLTDELLTPVGISEFRGTIKLKLRGGNTR